MIDSHDTNYDESKTQFYKLLENEALKNAVILIYANKQDLSGAKSVNDIIQIYELNKLKDHVWNIQPCSAQTGEGLITGMKWLSDQLVFKSDNNFPINPYVDYSENNKEENQEETKESEINNINNNINNEIKEDNKEENNIENKKEETLEEKIDSIDNQEK